MNTISKNFIPLLLLLVITACGNDEASSNTTNQPSAMALPVVNVPTKTVTTYKAYPARIEGVVNSEVRAKISGYITDVLVDERPKGT